MFYGWVIVAGVFMAQFFMVGFFTYGFPLLVVPVQEEFGASVTDESLSDRVSGIEGLRRQLQRQEVPTDSDIFAYQNSVDRLTDRLDFLANRIGETRKGEALRRGLIEEILASVGEDTPANLSRYLDLSRSAPVACVVGLRGVARDQLGSRAGLENVILPEQVIRLADMEPSQADRTWPSRTGPSTVATSVIPARSPITVQPSLDAPVTTSPVRSINCSPVSSEITEWKVSSPPIAKHAQSGCGGAMSSGAVNEVVKIVDPSRSITAWNASPATTSRSPSWVGRTQRTRLLGTANPMPMEPPLSVKMKVLMPMTSPRALTSAPPLLPGLMAASVWIIPR